MVLCNSNPATIMTDTIIADKVYMEPLTLEYIAKIIRYERPDAIIPGIGGQTGLNLAMQLEKKGILRECRVRLLGTSSESIERAEDRDDDADHKGCAEFRRCQNILDCAGLEIDRPEQDLAGDDVALAAERLRDEIQNRQQHDQADKNHRGDVDNIKCGYALALLSFFHLHSPGNSVTKSPFRSPFSQ